MSPAQIIEQLRTNYFVFKYLLEHKSAAEYTYKSSEDTWSLLEVACHLLDEEVEDFRARVKHILSSPGVQLPKIAPHLWPIERNYASQDFESTVTRFLKERQASVDWLDSLKQPNWELFVDHPEVGPRSAKKFLVNWLAHDYHHIRQINRIQHSFLKFSTDDDLTYAGKW